MKRNSTLTAYKIIDDFKSIRDSLVPFPNFEIVKRAAYVHATTMQHIECARIFSCGRGKYDFWEEVKTAIRHYKNDNE